MFNEWPAPDSGDDHQPHQPSQNNVRQEQFWPQGWWRRARKKVPRIEHIERPREFTDVDAWRRELGLRIAEHRVCARTGAIILPPPTE